MSPPRPTPAGDPASCSGAALDLLEVARLLDPVDATVAEQSRAMADALMRFADALRDARALAFRAERLAQEAQLVWSGRVVHPPEPIGPDEAVPESVARVDSLMSRSATATGKAQALLRAHCTEVIAQLEPAAVDLALGSEPIADRSVRSSAPPRPIR